MNDRKFRNWLKRNEPYIAPGDSAGIQKILNGSLDWIGGCVQWDGSPQGFLFWREKEFSRNLSKRTRQFLSKLRDEARRRGC